MRSGGEGCACQCITFLCNIIMFANLDCTVQHIIIGILATILALVLAIIIGSVVLRKGKGEQ